MWARIGLWSWLLAGDVMMALRLYPYLALAGEAVPRMAVGGKGGGWMS